MTMNDIVTIRGFVATDVRKIRTETDLQIASFRMCSTERRFDRQAGLWCDGDTNWYTVSCFRVLAQNVGFSVNKGDRILVTGRLKVRQWVTEAGKSGTSVEIEAEALGHDLVFGVSNFRRVALERAEEATSENAASPDGGQMVDPDTGELVEPPADELSTPPGAGIDQHASVEQGEEALAAAAR